MEPKSPVTKILEAVFALFLSAFFLRWTIRILKEIWPYLLIAAAVIFVGIVLWRVYLYFHNLGKW